ncbi:MAG: FtsW/RodA/SpoVE family cell cycle protein [Candidatus Saccharimonadales bacterium]
MQSYNQRNRNTRSAKPSFSGVIDFFIKPKPSHSKTNHQANKKSFHFAEPKTSINIKTPTNNPATVRRHRPDYGLLVSALLLSFIGLIVINAVGPTLAQQINQNSNYFMVKQIVFLSLGFAGFFISSKLKLSNMEKYAVFLLGSAFLACIVIFIPGLGIRVNGAIRWMRLGPLSFQPAELLKLSLILWNGYIFHKLIREKNINNFDVLKKVYYPVLIGVVLMIGFLQKDWGTLLAMGGTIAVPLFVSGISNKQLSLIAVAMISVALLITIIFPYRIKRLTAFLQKDDHSQTNNYHSNQAQIGLGSGGLFGKGLGKSEQIYGYLPEAANDSIFAVIGEKFGFIGSVTIVGIFGYLLRRLIYIMRRMPSAYTKTIVAGCFGSILGGVVVNIGGMLGLIPLLGVPLPLISFGGTSLVFTLITLGIAFNLSRYTVLSKL